MSSLAAGMVAGAIVGAAFALMYTPMRGSEVRRSIRRYASEGGEQLAHLVESGRSVAGDAIDRVACLIEEGRQAFRTSYTSGVESSRSSSYPSSQPLTASVAEITGLDRRFEEPLGG
jgi:gas vesicle protein